MKLGIDLHPTTVNKILQTFRKNGKIQSNGSWKKFLKAHWDTLFAMDYATPREPVSCDKKYTIRHYLHKVYQGTNLAHVSIG